MSADDTGERASTAGEPPAERWLRTLDGEVFACTVDDGDGGWALAQMQLPEGPVAICFSVTGLDGLPDDWDHDLVALDVADLHHWWPPRLGLWLDPGPDGVGTIYTDDAVRSLSRVTSLRGACAGLAESGADHHTVTLALADLVLRPSADVICAWLEPSPFDEDHAVGRLVLDDEATVERAEEVAGDLEEMLLVVAGVACRTVVEALDGELLRTGGLDPTQWDGAEMPLVLSRLDPPPPASGPLGPFSRLWLPMAAHWDDGTIGAPTVDADGRAAVIGFSTEDRVVASVPAGTPYLEVVLRQMEPWPDTIGLALDPGYADEQLVGVEAVKTALAAG